MSLNPEIWGPSAWLFLHSVTMAYPKKPKSEDKKKIKLFFTNVGSVLPCKKCSNNFLQHMKKSMKRLNSLKRKQ